ncbi:glycine cleavage system aminomethyltransferase GcvT [bacterium]|nr:glycine cleavage system aminomethyltransferase GcvT [bacterium]
MSLGHPGVQLCVDHVTDRYFGWRVQALSGETCGVKTALYEEHVKAGARIVDFAGYAMPIQYAGIVDEHRRVRSTAGIFDVSHMGEFFLSGSTALESLERITTNRASVLTDGRVQYSAMCYENGGFIDDLLVYRLGDSYMLVVNAANKAKDLDWVTSHLLDGTDFRDASDEMALIALQGPRSEEVLTAAGGSTFASLGYYHAGRGNVAGRTALVSRTGYTGEDGFEIYCEPGDAVHIWNAILDEGAPFDVEPVGLGCRDTLRLEMGYALYGNDIDDSRTPVESGLMWITKLKNTDFIGRDAIVRKKEEGIAARLVGFELQGRGVPRHGHAIKSGDETVGVVTSGTFAPSLEGGIGMGYLAVGTDGPIEIEVRNRRLAARIVRVPFYKDGSVKRG